MQGGAGGGTPITLSTASMPGMAEASEAFWNQRLALLQVSSWQFYISTTLLCRKDSVNRTEWEWVTHLTA